MNAIPYSELRDKIQDGDIISVLRPRKHASIFANTISFFTGSPIYHSGIAVWLTSLTGEKRLFIVEAQDQCRQVQLLSNYGEVQELHVLARPEYVNFGKFSSELINKVGVAPYSYLKALNSGIRQYFWLPKITGTGEYCSQLTLDMWKLGGLPLTDTQLDPAMAEKILVGTMRVEYRGWSFPG